MRKSSSKIDVGDLTRHCLTEKQCLTISAAAFQSDQVVLGTIDGPLRTAREFVSEERGNLCWVSPCQSRLLLLHTRLIHVQRGCGLMDTLGRAARFKTSKPNTELLHGTESVTPKGNASQSCSA